MISEELDSPVDLLQFAATCVSWHSAAKTNKLTIPTSLDHQVPMLLVYSNREKNTRRVYNVMNNKFLLSKQHVPNRRVRFCGSSKGWLASVSSDYIVTLHKSCFSVEHDHNHIVAPTICLPSLFPPQLGQNNIARDIYGSVILSPHEYHIRKLLLTTDPLINSNDCTAVVIFGEEGELAFIRLGRDTSWTRIMGDHCIEFDEVLYHNNQFYATNFYGMVVSFDIPESGNPVAKLVLLDEVPAISKRYLVTSPGGELWHIARGADLLDDNITRVTPMFKIFRLDDADSHDDDAKLVEIESLGDVALFLGDNSSISVIASKYLGCKANTIYFAHDADFTGGWTTKYISDFGIYEVKSKSFKLHYNMSSFTRSNMCNHHPIWVVPPMNI